MRTYDSRTLAPIRPERAAAGPSGLLGLQRQAGNRAVCAAVQRQAVSDAVRHTATGRTARFAADPPGRRRLAAGQPCRLTDYQPTTGIGRFDLTYDPATGALAVTVRCNFRFVSMGPSYGGSRPAVEGGWSESEAAAWRDRFLTMTTSTWSSLGVQWWCQEAGLTDLVAVPRVTFLAGTPEDAHFDVWVQRRSNSSSVTLGNGPGLRPGVFVRGDDIRNRTQLGAKQPQSIALHESGHMLGLDDEYLPAKGGPPVVGHAALVRDKYGRDVDRGASDRLMSGGMRVLPEYLVEVLSALEAATSSAWRETPAT